MPEHPHVQERTAAGADMVVLNIAMVGSDELAKSIAKAADQRDVHTYVHKETTSGETRILSIIRPAKYPERLRPLLNALSAGQAGLVEITAVDATLGEVLVAFASAGIDHGVAVINPPQGGWVDEDQVKMLFKQAGLGGWTFAPNDGLVLRDRLYDLLNERQAHLESLAAAPLVVPVDQHFNVKGIGLVAIGYVQAGELNVHDELMLLPANGTGNAKSLQVMDDDVPTARAGDRVGIALRNAKEDHLTGSTVLVRPAVDDKRTNTHRPMAVQPQMRSSVALTTSPFQKRVLAEGDVIHASVDLQFVVGRIQSVNGTVLEVAWDAPLLIREHQPPNVVIAQLDAKPRLMGSAAVTLLDA